MLMGRQKNHKRYSAQAPGHSAPWVLLLFWTDGQRTDAYDGTDGQRTDDDNETDDGTDGRTEDDDGDDGTDTTERTDGRYK